MALILNETNGVWETPVPLPGFAALNVGEGIDSLVISCSAPGDCVVGGDYTGQAPPSGQLPSGAFTATEIDGTWGNAQPVDTSELVGASDSTISSISCTSTGNCTAAGRYWSPAGSPAQAFLVTETDGAWSAAQQVPGSARYRRQALSTRMSRSRADPMAAAPPMATPTSREHPIPIIVDDVGGTWGDAQRVQGVPSGTEGRIDDVSCSGTGDCTAVGTYISDQRAVEFGVLETGGSSGGATLIPGPSYLLGAPAALSCARPGDCTLAGSYGSVSPIWTSGVSVATQSNGVWGKAGEIPGFPGASVASGAVIDSVSCSAPGTCSAAGFTYHSGTNTAFVANQTVGTWGSAQNVARASNTTTDAISCGGPGYCSVAVLQINVGSVYAPRNSSSTRQPRQHLRSGRSRPR